MSTERTDQYTEVSGEEAGIVPPQGAAKAEWPKKIRTLTANELDRLTIDGLGRFYWDGKLVNYEAHSSRVEQKPVDLDQHAMDLLDRTARELSDPNSVQEPAAEPQLESEPAPAADAPALAATPADQLAPVAPAAAESAPAATESAPAVVSAPAAAPASTPSPVIEVRRQEVLIPAPARAETVRMKLSGWQSIGLIIVIFAFLLSAAGFAASGFVTAHDWGCKVGLVQSYCPPPPPAPKAPTRPDIPA